MRLDDVADVRTGDKGDDLTVAVLARDAAAFATVIGQVTPERVAAHYGVPAVSVKRTVLPKIEATVFHFRGILQGGVTGSTYLDGHGKTMGYHLLTLPLSTSEQEEKEDTS